MRGQLQVLEPIIIVLILGILVAGGIIATVKVGKTQADSDAFILDAQNARSTLQTITNLPELSCPRSVTVETYCIDLYKAEWFSVMMKNDTKKSYYQPLFSSSRITLTYFELEDGGLTENQVILYDDVLNENNIGSISTYFTVYDPISDDRLFAWIMIQREI